MLTQCGDIRKLRVSLLKFENSAPRSKTPKKQCQIDSGAILQISE